VLGGIIVLGLGVDGFLSKFLLVIAIAFGTINVVGGFLVTDRMLEMFKSKPAPPQAVAEVGQGAGLAGPARSNGAASAAKDGGR
jgi:NAD(P) transhydrogenase subunit alpha